MELTNKTGIRLAEKEKDPKFLKRVKKLKDWILKNPYDAEAHRTLEGFYLSKNMFAEAEFEQEILEWLDRIQRSVKINNS